MRQPHCGSTPPSYEALPRESPSPNPCISFMKIGIMISALSASQESLREQMKESM